MANEDEISKVSRLEAKYDREIYKARYQTEHRSQSQVLSSEEENIDSQLALSKPLVTEIMEFFYSKERDSSNAQSLEELICELQYALEACLNSEENFMQAAFYDPSDNLPVHRQQRDAYAERTRFES